MFPEIATLHGNMLTESMPAEVCALRAGVLEELTADCGANSEAAGSPPFVDCQLGCCTLCF